MKLTFWTLVLAFSLGMVLDRFLMAPLAGAIFGRLLPTTTAS